VPSVSGAASAPVATASTGQGTPTTEPVGLPRRGVQTQGHRPPKEGPVLIEILVILLIIVLALFIWRTMAGRRV
jgi:hypothetical protein